MLLGDARLWVQACRVGGHQQGRLHSGQGGGGRTAAAADKRDPGEGGRGSAVQRKAVRDGKTDVGLVRMVACVLVLWLALHIMALVKEGKSMWVEGDYHGGSKLV